MKFVDVKNDIAFKKIFGNEKKTQILISFLNAILKLENQERITEVDIINPYLLPRVAGEKASIIDVRAKDVQGRQFVVEMQVADVNGFGKRVQYYACRDYSTQIERGDQYALLKPTYFIGILDFNFFDTDAYLSNHIILDEKTHKHTLKDIQFTFIELKKFDKVVTALESLTDKWIYFIKNARELHFIPENVDDSGLIEAYKDADKHSWDKEELIAYDNFFIAEQDEKGRLLAAEKKGKAEGRIEGKAEGRIEGKAEGKIEGKLENQKNIVKRCWNKNMTEEDIADITGLTIEEVHTIIQSFTDDNEL